MEKPYRILEYDPYLRPFKSDIQLRMDKFYDTLHNLTNGASLVDFANGHNYYGFHEVKDGWVYREWAPAADKISLIGDFNGWNAQSHPMTKLANGNWEIKTSGKLPHDTKVRLKITHGQQVFDRIPLYIKRTIQNPVTNSFDGVIWQKKYTWHDEGFQPAKPLLIYECHIGMSGEKEEIASFQDFIRDVLPRIKKLGYTAIQIMAIMEHPYYGSFGYQVSNFFAVSSRFGTPEDFKMLVDVAHQHGIAIIMDLVHSHVVKNTVEGLAKFDGTDYQFCHTGGKGDHPAWNTRLFNYGKPEVQHFLLSNIKYWLEEYHLDGFRFDGVTSMLYHHHGLGVAFDNYNKYFSFDTDTDAVTYLQLAAMLTKEMNANHILISEDMSGMPGMCIPIEDGGIGFDYRLNMGLPDYLIKLMNVPDEYWDLGTLWHELSNRRYKEKVVGYTESHDQALVGDKTLMFWLADKEMYWHMSKTDNSEIINRAISLHKMFRFITISAGGEGYLNFMGNEFGHPEWIDFPREGNDWSYRYCRRQWHLANDSTLKYSYLDIFDEAMIEFTKRHRINDSTTTLLYINNHSKIIAFSKGNDTFIFNFHPQNGFLHTLDNTNSFKIVFHSEWKRFGGFVNEEKNEGILRPDGVWIDRRCAVVVHYNQ